MMTIEQRDEYLEEVLIDEFFEDMNNIQNYLYLNWEKIKRQFQDLINNLFLMGFEAQQRGEKNKIEIFHICYLFSSCITKSHKVLFSLYDERFYLDSFEVSAFWTPEFIFQYFEREMDIFQKKAQKNIIGFDYSDMQEVRLKYYEMYYQVVGEILQMLIPVIKDATYFKKIEKTDKFCVSYSKYMIPGWELDFKL